MSYNLKQTSHCLLGGLAIFIGSTLVQAAEFDMYGKIHISGDYIDNSTTEDFTLGSNSSRIGFKGEKALKHDIKAIWKIESDIDVSGERGELKARNRYLGLSHQYGTIIAGYHDTPFKIIGKKAGIMHDTIGERRGVLGAGNGDNKFNIRGKNSVLYISPNLSGFEVSAMHSAGDDSDPTLDENPVTSVSALYKNKTFYAGIAYEDQSKLDTDGIRLAGGVSLGKTNVNGIFEQLNSTTNKKFDRNAYGLSASHSLGDTKLEAQLFVLEDYTGTSNSGAILYAVGAEHKLGDDFTVYGIVAAVNNEENAKVVLAGSGHGEKYTPALGKDLTGLSLGMIYKF